MDRREFFRRVGGRDKVVRPPGAASEEIFSEICNGCNKCVRSCPQNIIVAGFNGFPKIDFSQNSCTFCGLCIEACETGALTERENLQASWKLRARILENCLDKNGITCRACESSCEEEAIKFYPALGGKTNAFINLEKCNGCGACVSACHAQAITMFQPETNITNKEKIA